MFFTYIIESIRFPGKRYIGHTGDINQRLIDHNDGKCNATKHFRPWKLKIYLAFETQAQARKFKLYLKTGSGKAFAKRHFWNQE